MKSQDWQDADSARNLAISQLAEICAQAGLSWSADEKTFIIDLPDVVVSRIVPSAPTKKTFDISTWGPVGIDETENIKVNDDGAICPIDPTQPSSYSNPLPDDFQMPDVGEILEEGEPPVGDKEAEK